MVNVSMFPKIQCLPGKLANVGNEMFILIPMVQDVAKPHTEGPPHHPFLPVGPPNLISANQQKTYP